MRDICKLGILFTVILLVLTGCANLNKPCVSDTDCSGTKPYCDSSLDVPACVMCLEDSHCSGMQSGSKCISNACQCENEGDCGAGLVCVEQGDFSFCADVDEVCGDGIDNDNDGMIDYFDEDCKESCRSGFGYVTELIEGSGDGAPAIGLSQAGCCDDEGMCFLNSECFSSGEEVGEMICSQGVWCKKGYVNLGSGECVGEDLFLGEVMGQSYAVITVQTDSPTGLEILDGAVPYGEFYSYCISELNEGEISCSEDYFECPDGLTPSLIDYVTEEHEDFGLVEGYLESSPSYSLVQKVACRGEPEEPIVFEEFEPSDVFLDAYDSVYESAYDSGYDDGFNGFQRGYSVDDFCSGLEGDELDGCNSGSFQGYHSGYGVGKDERLESFEAKEVLMSPEEKESVFPFETRVQDPECIKLNSYRDVDGVWREGYIDSNTETVSSPRGWEVNSWESCLNAVSSEGQGQWFYPSQEDCKDNFQSQEEMGFDQCKSDADCESIYPGIEDDPNTPEDEGEKAECVVLDRRAVRNTNGGISGLPLSAEGDCLEIGNPCEGSCSVSGASCDYNSVYGTGCCGTSYEVQEKRTVCKMPWQKKNKVDYVADECHGAEAHEEYLVPCENTWEDIIEKLDAKEPVAITEDSFRDWAEIEYGSLDSLKIGSGGLIEVKNYFISWYNERSPGSFDYDPYETLADFDWNDEIRYIGEIDRIEKELNEGMAILQKDKVPLELSVNLKSERGYTLDTFYVGHSVVVLDINKEPLANDNTGRLSQYNLRILDPNQPLETYEIECSVSWAKLKDYSLYLTDMPDSLTFFSCSNIPSLYAIHNIDEIILADITNFYSPGEDSGHKVRDSPVSWLPLNVPKLENYRAAGGGKYPHGVCDAFTDFWILTAIWGKFIGECDPNNYYPGDWCIGYEMDGFGNPIPDERYVGKWRLKAELDDCSSNDYCRFSNWPDKFCDYEGPFEDYLRE